MAEKMEERLSGMVGYCDKHDLRYDSLGCPVCVIDKFDAPPGYDALSALERDVVEKAGDLNAAEQENGWGSMAAQEAHSDLMAAVRALRASRKPAGVRPSEVAPGTRFKWAEGCDRDFQLHEVLRMRDQYTGERPVRCFTIEGGEDHRVYTFDPEDRILPLDPQE